MSATVVMKNKNLDKIIGKLIELTKYVYLKEPEDGSGLAEKFFAGYKQGTPLLGGFGTQWWVTRKTIECCEDISAMAINFDRQLEGGDKDSFVEIIRQTLRENTLNKRIFLPDSVLFRKPNTLFEARASENPREFAVCLWEEIYHNLSDSQIKWLTMYPLQSIKSRSFVLGFDGLTVLKSDDQEQWEQLSEKYEESRYWMPSTGTWLDRERTNMKDFGMSPTWLTCEVSGTASSTRSLSSDNMRTFIAILLSCLNDGVPNLLMKNMASPAKYSIQFPNDSKKANCGSTMVGIGALFPPLINSPIGVSCNTLEEIQNWYQSRDKALENAAQRATTAAHFLHNGVTYDGINSFIHFFIVLDSLFGERYKVEQNIKEGIKQTFSGKLTWADKADQLFDLRNELIHGGISDIKRWNKLDHYERLFKSHPVKDMQIVAMTALRLYFKNRVFEHLFCT
jgi:hypothetical protein